MLAQGHGRMRRADRLFQLVQALRRRQVVTAQQLADELEVSVRTVYRDIADLVGSGVPITGEAGVGYAIDRGWDMPPLMFTVEELEALVLGARMVESWCGETMAAAARDVLVKVEQVLPRRLQDRMARTALFVPDAGWSLPGSELLADLRQAIREQKRVRIAYTDAADNRSERVIHPLGVFFWGAVVTVAAWCELREAFRNFRLDRFEAVELLPETFESAPGRTLQDYYRRMAEDEGDRGGEDGS